MEKIELGKDEHGDRTLLGLWEVWAKQCEIIDWLTAHDERKATREQREEFGFRSSDELKDGHPCGKHNACLSHITHPCEGCGRIGGRFTIEQELTAGLAEPEGELTAHDFMEIHLANFHSITTLSIEQEIMAGLLHCKFAKHNGEPCTRIYLPAEKYEEYIAWQTRDWDGSRPMKRKIDANIPVYCGGPDIHYCTD